jgi:hypothetical protein
MARKDAHPGKREAAVERHIQAFELRKAGASFREIAATLGVSVGTAYEDVQRVLAELTAQRQATAAEYVAMELERLDAAQFALFQHLDSGDPQIVNSWVRVSESRRKLLGLDQPIDINLQGALQSPAYIALRAVVLQALPTEQRMLVATALDQVIIDAATDDTAATD